jgi:hypothetical protein
MLLVCHWTPPEGTDRSLAFKGGVINCRESYYTGSGRRDLNLGVQKRLQEAGASLTTRLDMG